MTTASKLANLYLTKQAVDLPEEDAGSIKEILPGQFIDLAAYTLALNAYVQLKGEDDHVKKGLLTYNRYIDEISGGLDKFFSPLISEGAFTRFRSLMTVATLPRRGLLQVTKQAMLLSQILPLLHTHSTKMREIFSDSRAFAQAQKVAAIVANEAPASVLNGLATLPSVSRVRVTQKWIREAAESAGVAPSLLESALADAEGAKNLGEDLHKVEAALGSTDPVSEAGADLQAKRKDILGQIEDVAKGSVNPAMVLSVAATAAVQAKDYATKTAKAQHLSPDQEKAMMARGKAIIAAGAGSGKTSCLASKVVYHINELGVPPGAIIATSFSRKSAAELRKRIEKYGADFPTGTDTGLGTTHSVAGKLMREYGRGGKDNLKNFEQSHLVRLAMAQVMMKGATEPPPAPESLFSGASEGQASVVTGLTFFAACEMAYKKRGQIRNPYLRDFISSYFDRSNQWYNVTMRSTKNLTDPRGLSDKQVKVLKDVFKEVGVEYSLATDPNFAPKTASVTVTEKQAAPARDKDRGLREKYQYFARPAGKWFNLGLELSEDGPKGEKQPIPAGFFKGWISKFKGKAISPSEAWAQTGGAPEAAVYAAYEWLKSPDGEVDFQGRGDFDDLLIETAKMLASSPSILQKVQSRFKVVLIDEAQDLNRCQHLLFGLVAGYVDPAKVSKVGQAKKMKELAKDDNAMTADTYCFIGDDKQSIYSFRGADPEAFIDMSDLVAGGAGFKTETLKTNYRSGELIVEAANRLISHNKKQIPLTCNANPQRVDKGGVKTVRFAPITGRDVSEPAKWLAAQIEDVMASGDAGKKGYDAFGVGLRSNAEAYAYGLEFLKKGIPFRSKVNFFTDPNTKALLYWLTIADEGLDGNVDRINEAVLGARSAPATKLGPKFEDKLTELAKGNYISWLEDNWTAIYGSRGDWADLVQSYVSNLQMVAGLKGEPAEEVFNTILSLQGFDGRTVSDALVDKIRDDEEALAEILAESPTGSIDEEDIKEVAFAPLAPLKGLLGARPDLTEAMKYVRQLQNANAKLSAVDDPDAKGVDEPAVTLGTMHSWKGLEVPRMYLPLVGGRFPRSGSTEEDLESERRLAYVAVTRGEQEVTVMNIPTVKKTGSGSGAIVTIVESRFIEEMCVPSTSAMSDAELEYKQEGWEDAALTDEMSKEKDRLKLAASYEAQMNVYLQSRKS